MSRSQHLPRRSTAAVPIWLVAVVMAACQNLASPEPSAVVEAPTAAALSGGPHSPLAGLEAPVAGHREWTGIVAEQLSAGRYRYLRVDEQGTSHWVATTGVGPNVGERVHVRSYGTRHDFDSTRLGRRFDELVFGSVRVVDDPSSINPGKI